MKNVREVGGHSISMAVQQEQPLAPPALAVASVNADSTMTAAKHKGTVYPDISVIRYLFGVNDKFQTLKYDDMNHEKVDYLVCAELKRSIKLAFIRQGLDPNTNLKGYEQLSKSMRKAAFQATRQAFVAMKRPGDTNSDIILIAATGPFWMWCLGSRALVLGTFKEVCVEDILDETQEEQDRDTEKELNTTEDDDESFTPISSAPHGSMTKKDVFKGYEPLLPWSDVAMLDTKASEKALRALLEVLITVVHK